MRLMQLQPVRENNHLVGWMARFADEAGQVRIARLGLGCLLDPLAFTQAVARQGVRFEVPTGTDPATWKALVRDLTAAGSRA
jgi:hypothetical protein